MIYSYDTMPSCRNFVLNSAAVQINSSRFSFSFGCFLTFRQTFSQSVPRQDFGKVHINSVHTEKHETKIKLGDILL